jgi:hypothetical protein
LRHLVAALFEKSFNLSNQLQEDIMDIKVLYLQNSLSANGRSSLAGRNLYDHFRNISKECVLGHFVTDDEHAEKCKDRVYGTDVISYSLLSKLLPNVIYIEGGLFLSEEGRWKIPRPYAEELLRDGAVIFIADVDLNELRFKKQLYDEIVDFTGAHARYMKYDGKDPVEIMDLESNWNGSRQIICNADDMVVSDWLKPAYDGVDKILVGIPGRLEHFRHVLASGNRSTTQANGDVYGFESDSGIFASVSPYLNGQVIFIAGNISGDSWSNACPDNLKWFENITRLLLTKTSEEKKRKSDHFRSKFKLFLSHRSLNKDIVRLVADALKRNGIGIWLDADNMIPSDSLISKISEGLDQMTHFIIFWSADCINAKWVEKELNVGISRLVEHEIPLIIVRLDNTSVPAIISDSLRIEAAGMEGEEIAELVSSTIERLEKRKGMQAK